MFLNKLKAGIKTETILPKFTFAGLIFQTTKKSKRREERGEEQEKFYQWEGGKIDWVHQITTFYLVFQHFKLLFKMLLFFFFFWYACNFLKKVFLVFTVHKETKYFFQVAT